MKALLIVDVQNDFVPGGALPVKEGHEVVPVINELLNLPFDAIVATKDWHPSDHGSFAANHGKEPGEKIMLAGLEQILWPVHCVQDSPGAEFFSGLEHHKVHRVFCKGVDKDIDSYSGFFDNGHRKSTGVDNYFRQEKITDVYVVGLATDYCVKYSVLDALKLGYNTYVVKDACRGVDLQEGDSDRALEEMEKAGACIISSQDLLEKKAFG